MPFYEYRCDACGHEFEALQKISDTPLTDCPSCTEAELVKKVSAAGFRLKGGGWYETDFKKGAKNNVGDSDKKVESTKSTKSEGHSCSSGACSTCS
jgi:putative FmdB family regulatory protein